MDIRTDIKLNFEKIFIILSLFFGLLYVLILPPFQSVDESSHFFRGYEITTRMIIPKNERQNVGDNLPTSLETLASKYNFLIKNIDAKINPTYIYETSKIKLAPENKKFIDFKNTALYSPVCYISQVPGMFVGKIFNANPLLIFYLGRISNLIFFTILGFLTIQIIPKHKLTAMLFLLMPMTLSLAASLTSDVVVIGFNFLWVAFILKLIHQQKFINKKEITALILLALILASAKNYFMLIPLIFLLPKSRFNKFSQYLMCIFGVIFASITSFALWQHVTNDFNLSMNPNANAAEQINFILTHPINYILILVKTFIVKLGRLFITTIGVLGWQDTRLDFLTYILYPVMITASIFSEKSTKVIKKWQKILIIINLILSTIIIFTIMYIMWSPVGSNIITGLNGKYFIPLLLPLALLFKGQIQSENKHILDFLIICMLILILISSDLSLLHRFYDITPNLYYKI